tara:strand:- start:115 stop:321 length:207 start_codon:yes stop_codon:yes gene_type:complete
MIKLHLTNRHGGTPLHMYLTGNFTMYERYDHNKPNAITVIMDGCHNNGGWHVEESVKEVNRMINEQLD